jgi:hypothetical protein
VPIEEMVLVWKSHWFWKKFIADEDVHVGGNHLQMAKNGRDTKGADA